MNGDRVSDAVGVIWAKVLAARATDRPLDRQALAEVSRAREIIEAEADDKHPIGMRLLCFSQNVRIDDLSRVALGLAPGCEGLVLECESLMKDLKAGESK